MNGNTEAGAVAEGVIEPEGTFDDTPCEGVLKARVAREDDRCDRDRHLRERRCVCGIEYGR